MGAGPRRADGGRARRGASASASTARCAQIRTEAEVGVKGVTYDTGALLAAERNDRRMWALHAGFLAEEVVPTVPAPVLAQAWRGGAKQASLSRLLALCVVESMSEEQARAVGRLASRARHGDIVDLAVVEGALRRQDAIVTSDPKDILRVAAALSERIRIEAV